MLYPMACLGKHNEEFENRFLESKGYFEERTRMLVTDMTQKTRNKR